MNSTERNAVGQVRFGAEGNWTVWKKTSGGVLCASTVFGDPLPGVVKRCECKAVKLQQQIEGKLRAQTAALTAQRSQRYFSACASVRARVCMHAFVMIVLGVSWVQGAFSRPLSNVNVVGSLCGIYKNAGNITRHASLPVAHLSFRNCAHDNHVFCLFAHTVRRREEVREARWLMADAGKLKHNSFAAMIITSQSLHSTTNVSDTISSSFRTDTQATATWFLQTLRSPRGASC